MMRLFFDPGFFDDGRSPSRQNFLICHGEYGMISAAWFGDNQRSSVLTLDTEIPLSF